MHLERFYSVFDVYFPEHEQAKPSPVLETSFTRSFFDPWFGVAGMTSVKVQQLLRIAASCLTPGEAYLEVGTYRGKTLLSALAGNDHCLAYACDNFSEFSDDPVKSYDTLARNLQASGYEPRVSFFNDDFRNVLNRERIPDPVGVYFYDGGHTVADHADAIACAERLLADNALVIIDDWNFEEVREGTAQGVAQAAHTWQQRYVLPARTGQDLGLWWNGIAVYEFRRAQ